MGTYGANNSTSEEATLSTPNKLKNFSSGSPSSAAAAAAAAAALMSSLDDEIDDKTVVGNNQDSGAFGEGRGNNYVPNYPMSSWDDTAIISDNITGLKRLREEDTKPFSGLNNNAAETRVHSIDSRYLRRKNWLVLLSIVLEVILIRIFMVV